MKTDRFLHPLDCPADQRTRARRFTLTGIALLTILLAVLLATARAGNPAGLDLDAPRCGELLWRTEAGLLPLPSVGTYVTLRVGGPLIAGRVVQRFTNPTDEIIEAVYVFPLPEQAAVNGLEIVIGERRIVSVVRERQAARRTYEAARAEGRRAALVESERPNLFTTSVANICPGETIEVTLEYFDTVDFAAGEFGLTFPLTFTPRFVPPLLLSGSTEPGTGEIDAVHVESLRRVLAPFVGPGGVRFPTAVLRVELDAGVLLGDVHSVSHPIVVRDHDGVREITTLDAVVPADRDFRLQWSASSTGPVAACFIEDRPDGRHALVMAVPDAVAPASGPPAETLFVIDVSGSMQGPSIRQARSALLRALDRLRPDDRFNVLAFSDDSALFGRGLLPSSAMTLSEARSWVARLDAGGGTMMHPALLRAATQFLDAGASRPGTVRRIVMITDAAVGNEDQLLREAAGGLGDVRLHIVGIGAAPNRYLVRRLAALGGGLSAFVADPDESLAVIDDFIARIDRPVLRDLRLEWTGAAPLASHPERLPELFAGELLLWSGRFPAGAKVAGRLTAAGDDGAWSCTLDAPREAVGTAARGGRLAVEELMADLAAGAPLERIRPLVVETALTHGLVTQFTSRVAVEDAPGPGEAARVCRLPNGLPAGSRLLDGVPATGTGRPSLALLGGVLVAAGAGGLLLRRRRAVRA